LVQQGLTSIPKGNIVGIDVFCSVANVFLLGIDFNLAAWVGGVLEMHVYVWL